MHCALIKRASALFYWRGRNRQGMGIRHFALSVSRLNARCGGSAGCPSDRRRGAWRWWSPRCAKAVPRLGFTFGVLLTLPADAEVHFSILRVWFSEMLPALIPAIWFLLRIAATPPGQRAWFERRRRHFLITHSPGNYLAWALIYSLLLIILLSRVIGGLDTRRLVCLLEFACLAVTQVSNFSVWVHEVPALTE